MNSRPGNVTKGERFLTSSPEPLQNFCCSFTDFPPLLENSSFPSREGVCCRLLPCCCCPLRTVPCVGCVGVSALCPLFSSLEDYRWSYPFLYIHTHTVLLIPLTHSVLYKNAQKTAVPSPSNVLSLTIDQDSRNLLLGLPSIASPSRRTTQSQEVSLFNSR